MIYKGWQPESRGVSTPLDEHHFWAHFGSTWDVIYQIWMLLEDLPCGAKLSHLLWGVLHCKVYGTESVLASIAGVDKKTFRKWSFELRWAMSVAIDKVVSRFFVLF